MGVTLDNSYSTMVDSSGSTSFSYTAASGSQMYVLTSFNVSAITYNSVSLTKLIEFEPSINDGNQQQMRVWYLSNPASGSNTLATTVSGQDTCSVVTFTGMSSTQQHDYLTRFSNNGTINTQVSALNLGHSTTAYNSYMLLFAIGSSGTLVAGSDTTLIVNHDSIFTRSSAIHISTNVVSSPGSITLENQRSSGSTFMSIIAMPISPVFESSGSFMNYFI
jgi:hypothetical protein